MIEIYDGTNSEFSDVCSLISKLKCSLIRVFQMCGFPKLHEGVVVEPRTINDKMILDPDLGGTDDLKSDLRDL